MGIDEMDGVEIARWIHLLSVVYQRAMRARPELANMSQPRLRLLVYIYFLTRGSYPQGVPFEALRRMRGITKGTLSTLLQALEKEGWIRRIPDPQDGRRIQVLPTEATIRAIETQAPAHFLYLNRLVASLTREERATLIALLEKLYHGLQTYLQAREAPLEGKEG